MTVPEHDWNIPHTLRIPEGEYECPPGCPAAPGPFAVAVKDPYAGLGSGHLTEPALPEHDLCGPDAPKTATGLAYEQGRRAERERVIALARQHHARYVACEPPERCGNAACGRRAPFAALLEGDPGVRVVSFVTPADGPVMTMDDLNEHVAGLLEGETT